MRSSGKLIFILMFAVIWLAGTAGAKIFEDVVAKVNGRPLMLSEYRKNLRSVIDTYRRNIPDMLGDKKAVAEIRAKVLDQMIDDEILAMRADALKIKIHNREVDQGIEEVKKRSFAVDALTGKRRTLKEIDEALKEELSKEGINEAKFRKRIEKQLKIRKVVEAEVRSKMKEPDDKRAKKAFERLRKITTASSDTVRSIVADLPEVVAQGYIAFGYRLRDAHAERVRVSHILVKIAPGSSMVAKTTKLEKARGVKKRLDGGADFYELARKESEDVESAPRGGDLGFILRGWMPRPFEDAAFSLPVGQVSDPVESDFGYHVIRVQEKKAGESLNYDKLGLDIKQFLMNLDFANELQDLIARLRKKATIEVKLPTQ